MGGMSSPQTPPSPASSPRFEKAVQRLLLTEGGFVNDPRDNGGATKYGVSLRFLVGEKRVDPAIFAQFDLGIEGDISVADIAALTPEEAERVYWLCFWGPVHAENFPAPIGEMMFDQGVNDGLVPARKLLQQAINRCTAQYAHFANCPAALAVDGLLGPGTNAAFAWVHLLPAAGMPALVNAYRLAAAARYRAIAEADPAQRGFLEGWLTRAADLGKDV